jgi:hypothetical protein
LDGSRLTHKPPKLHGAAIVTGGGLRLTRRWVGGCSAAIEDMLEMMELQHCYGWHAKLNPPGGANRHAVGNLTDSEQWRLMVAVNLLTGPTCLLLNEPTTGACPQPRATHATHSPQTPLPLLGWRSPKRWASGG